MSEECLVVGLGNPGAKYEKNRHNLGFMVVKAFAKKQGWSFKRGWRLKGNIASGIVGEKKVYLLLPTTYMNLSGKSVRKLVDYYKIASHNLMIVVDDVNLRLGVMRLRKEGSSGGHNGLKSMEECLKTQEYPRLRLGVGPQGENGFSAEEESDLKNYVLANFNVEEQRVLPALLERSRDVLQCWISQGAEPAIQRVGELNKQSVGF